MAEGDMSSCGGHIDQTRMFKVQVGPFPGSKTEDMFHYLVPLLEKMPQDVTGYEASYIVKKILQVKKIIKLRVLNCKVIISRSIKTHYNHNASRVIEEVISQFQKLTIDMIGNENIEKIQLEKRGLHLNGFGLKIFAQNFSGILGY